MLFIKGGVDSLDHIVEEGRLCPHQGSGANLLVIKQHHQSDILLLFDLSVYRRIYKSLQTAECTSHIVQATTNHKLLLQAPNTSFLRISRKPFGYGIEYIQVV